MKSLPIVYGCPAPCAAFNLNGKHSEEEEEARHAKTDFVDGRVAHKCLAIRSCIQLFTNFCIERNLKTNRYKDKSQRLEKKQKQNKNKVLEDSGKPSEQMHPG